MTRACANCHFSHAYVLKRDEVYRLNMLKGAIEKIVPPIEEERLKCRRYAPGRVFWPEVEPTDWCGEFEEKRHD